MKRIFSCGTVLVAALLAALAGAAHAQTPSKSATLDAVKKRGQLICGIDTGIPGYAYQDSAGKWQGLDVALCRAIAAAALGDAEQGEISSVSPRRCASPCSPPARSTC